MNHNLLAASRIRVSLSAPPAQQSKEIRRIFNNDQLIERFDQWLLICGKAENTRTSYTLAARQFARSLMDRPLTAATKQDVSAFIAALYGRMAPTTIQARLDAIRVLFDFLTLGGQVRVSVPRFVTRRKLPSRLPRAKSEEEIERLIAATRKPRDRAIIELGYASGLRVSELAALRIEDVNIRARSLVVRKGKGGNDRIALFGRKAAEAIREYVGDRSAGRLFTSEPRRQRGGITRGKHGDWWGQWRERGENEKLVLRSVRLGDYDIPSRERARAAFDAFLADKIPKNHRTLFHSLTGRSIYRIVVAAGKRAGIEGMHPHILRHSMATHCLNRGMDIRFVQELLGHTSLVATQKYLHVAVENLVNVHRNFFPRG